MNPFADRSPSACASRRRRCGAILPVLLVALPAAAQTDQKLLFDEWKQGATFQTTAGALVAQRASMGGAKPDSRLAEYTATGRFRLDTSHELNPSFGYDVFVLDLADPMKRVPGRLTDTNLAFGSPLGTIEDWFFTATLGGGYAGDNAFGNNKSWYGKGTFSAGTELSKNEHLLLWIEYDGNRTLFPDVPLPFFAYANDVSESFSFILGIPESDLEWRPTDKTLIKLEWDAPFTIDASAEIQLTKALTLFAKYQDQSHAFHVENYRRVDRIFYSEQRAEGGLRAQPFDCLAITLAAGYAFGRDFQQGFDDRQLDRVTRLGDAPYIRLEFALEF